ncbi:translation initiation factor IF-2 [Candidatus Curtissbacteria bacterium]|nr:translation initiation factor IF-2 [Candidatus Curtissbacteria bacterium]
MNQKPDTNFRPPVVTVLGHVDHGKTTLLDTIRKTNVAAREHGGITQHIGAYQIIHEGKPITFIDTPGHAAFEKMRSRGANIADIIILVVSADDGVKPQTVEAIKHIKASQKPYIVAITKTDLPDINLEKVKKQLQKEDVVVESYGGDVPLVEVAAIKNRGIKELLEMINLVWQLSPEQSQPNEPLESVVVESFLDKNRGPVVTVIVKKGTLGKNRKIEIDNESVTIKALVDENGQIVEEALPGKPVEVLGFKKVLEVGSIIREQTQTRVLSKKPLDMADIIARAQQAKGRFKVIIKADVAGSLEAILENLPKDLLVISSGIGQVTENDISFAKTTDSPILSFNTKISGQIKSRAEREGIVIKSYDVIYQLLEDMEEVATSFQEAKHELKVAGRAKIVAAFNIEGKKIAGAVVTHGRLKIGDSVIIKRTNGQSLESKIISLKRFKKDAETVLSGQDCGIGFATNVDFSEGDIIESLG